jgi:alpha-glucosidase
VDIDNYENQMEDAFAYCRELGIDAVKTGYVGRMCQGEWHHGQYMVRHYRKVLELAAEYGVMLDVHEPIKDTGIRRTWPNMMTREGARGQEYNAWSGDGGNPPEHETILPFTRMLSGPFDFTPGIFRLLYPELRENNRVNTTLAKQLALYVVLYSPLQMAADLPENYANHPAFQFIRDVPCDWSITRVLDGKIGDHVTIVRKDRSSEDWFLGSVTDENARELEVSLDFLDPALKYIVTHYQDGPDADWEDNPDELKVAVRVMNSGNTLALTLAPGGGAAVHFHPLPH